MTKNSHCSYCGAAFAPDQPWPRRCAACANVSYINPLPVAVMLVPMVSGLLLVRRTNAPQIGKLGLPGGFIEIGETWQQAGAREVREETQGEIAPDQITLFDVRSAPDGTVLVFGLAPPLPRAVVDNFASTGETSELVVAHAPLELAFSTHTETMARYFVQMPHSSTEVLSHQS